MRMGPRSRPLAVVLGVLLILLGLASVSLFYRPDAPMEEPASPGRTTNPSKTLSPFAEWWLYPSIRMSRFFRYAGGAGGVACLVVGTMFLVAKRSRSE